VNQLFMPIDHEGADASARSSVPRPPTATQMAASIELVGDISLGIDDADLRHVECAGDATEHSAQMTQTNSLKPKRVVAA
jgi:hypothetical protein